jgi:hypothetical protein
MCKKIFVSKPLFRNAVTAPVIVQNTTECSLFDPRQETGNWQSMDWRLTGETKRWLLLPSQTDCVVRTVSFLMHPEFYELPLYLPLVSLVVWGGGVRLSPLGTSATVWSIVPAPDDRWWWMWSCRWNENWQGKPKTSSSANFSNTNPTWPDLGSNPATNRWSYGTAHSLGISHSSPWYSRNTGTSERVTFTTGNITCNYKYSSVYLPWFCCDFLESSDVRRVERTETSCSL